MAGSEYRRLTAVLMHRPGPEIGGHRDPASVLHVRPIDPAALAAECDALEQSYRRLGIAVVRVDASPLSGDRSYRYNLLYCRDLLFMTPNGAVLARMAPEIRREEVRYAERALWSQGIPVLGAVGGEGTFEGADALWIDEKLVIVGVGGRTNEEGFAQVRRYLERTGVSCVALPFTAKATQHLLGVVQIVDRDRAVVRHEIAGSDVLRFLEERKMRIVPVPESDEVRNRQAMNFVVVAPGTVVMAAGCPGTRDVIGNEGITVAAEVPCGQFVNGGGGLACATGILARS